MFFVNTHASMEIGNNHVLKTIKISALPVNLSPKSKVEKNHTNKTDRYRQKSVVMREAEGTDIICRAQQRAPFL